MHVKVAVVSVVIIVVACGAQSQAEGPPPPGVCRTLESPAEGNLRYGLPREWRLEDAVVVDYEGMRRSFDDAPSSVIAAWIVDADGQRLYEEPGVFIFRGGTTQEFEQRPKDIYTLNDVSERAVQAGFDALDEEAQSTRRARRNASTLTPPFSEADSVVQEAVRCVIDGFEPARP